MTPFILTGVGLFAGLFLVSMGGGGGAVYVGILTGLCDIPPDIAASTSLATVIPTTMMGAYSHYRAGNVHWRLAMYLLAGCIPGAIIGSLFSTLLPLWVYNKITGTILVTLALQMGWTCIHPPKHEMHNNSKLGRKDIAKVAFFGILGGLMTGLVGSSGGGPITAGLFILGCAPLAAVGTSVSVICIMCTASFLMHLTFGRVDWQLVEYLLSGTMIGAFLGPLILSKLDKNKVNKVLRPIVTFVKLIIGIVVLMK